MSETWTEKTEQSETWSAISSEQYPRTFSPRVFSTQVVSGLRVFDTGPTSGVWDAQTEQSEIWTVVT
jgi:hypothetical protein